MKQQSLTTFTSEDNPYVSCIADTDQLEIQEKRDAASILVISATIASLGLLIVLVSSHYPTVVLNLDKLNLYVFHSSLYKPEPNEHTIYVLCASILPLICGILYFFSTRLLSFFKKQFFLFYQLISFVLICSLLALFLRGLTHFNYKIPNSMYEVSILKILVSVIVIVWIITTLRFSTRLFIRSNSILNYLFICVSLILITVLSIERVFNETEPYVYGFHFTAYFDSIVQVYLGKTLLVNNSAQYGLYALLLKPIFMLIGLSVFKFTLVMGVLEAIWQLCFFSILRFTVKNRWISFAGFVNLIFFVRLRIPNDIINGGLDPTFQYAPHRMIFPALFLFLIWLHLSQNNLKYSKILHVLISFTCIVGVLWSPDSGIVLSITWTIYILYSEVILLKVFDLKRILRNISIKLSLFCLVSFFTVLCLYLYIYFTSTHWPNIFEIFDHVRLFGSLGFFLLPVEHLVHPWNILIVIYVIGIFLGVRQFLETVGLVKSVNNNIAKNRIITFIFIVSILGIGLFGYYVGRSHDLNLIGPSWPALLLLVIYCDRTFHNTYDFFCKFSNKGASVLQVPSYYRTVVFAGTFYIITSSVINVISYLPLHKDLITRRISGVFKGIPEPLTAQIQFINQNTKPGDSVIILSDYAPVLYLHSNHMRAVDVPGFANDLIFRKDFDKLLDFLQSPPNNAKIFYSPSFSSSTLTPNNFGDKLKYISSTKDLSLSYYSISQEILNNN